jgi:hypothetical protein
VDLYPFFTFSDLLFRLCSNRLTYFKISEPVEELVTNLVSKYSLPLSFLRCFLPRIDYIALNGKMIVKDELEGMWKEAVVICFKILFGLIKSMKMLARDS